jgi:cold shock CspA family protein/ribosome-associated translation inhibitor RaiA
VDVPAEIAFRNVEPTAALKDLIQEGIKSLEKVHPRLVSCRVMVEEVSRGVPHVRLDIGIPGSELVVNNRETPVDPSSRDVATAIREAFDVARRQLREQRMRRSVAAKRKGRAPQGRIATLVTEAPDHRYGFLLSEDGREIYFDESAVRGMVYDDLVEGLEVHFTESSGKQGATASSVSPLSVAQRIAVDGRPGGRPQRRQARRR